MLQGRTLSAGNVIDEQATRSTPVVRPSDGPKRLRAGGIPTYAGAVSTEAAEGDGTATGGECGTRIGA